MRLWNDIVKRTIFSWGPSNMHSVGRSTEPTFLSNLRSSHTRWDELEGSDRRRIRAALARDFGNVCGYCEQSCRGPSATHDGRNEETIDHFRPRSRCSKLWLDWLNLVYACRRCNKAKDNKWPAFNDGINQFLAKIESRYTEVSEFVNPNAGSSPKPANDYFEFLAPSGEIKPREGLDDVEWSKARRTIADIDLNDSELGPYDERHLCNRRRGQIKRLMERLRQLDTFGERVQLMREFTLPDKPFSSFVTEYIWNRFPLMEDFLRDDEPTSGPGNKSEIGPAP